ncbi:uncharacterized protein LOC111077441 [Drosophila obscura]|uniref:uncharacterized protein LOC111077441 n=1 Tax=Drosophila obscura TaxID=7282 RepID=UPI001BB293BE|nr:uncharacterized protein LOC111077441 [Drosophila obscura]
MFAPGVCLVFVSVFLVLAVNGAAPPPLSVNVHEGGAAASSLLPSACRSTVNGSVEIRLPFMDMELSHEYPFYLLREPIEDVLLVLHGYELFQLHVASGGNKRLVRLGELAGRLRALPAASLGAEVVAWRQFLLLAIVLPETLEVYQLPKEQLMAEGTQLSFEPIQEFSLAHGFQQMHLLRHPAPEKVLLLLASNYTKSQGRIQTFEWLDTYFNPVEDLFLPAIRTLQLVGQQPLYILTGRSVRGSHSKLVITVFELEPATMHLRTRQTLTTQARHVLTFRFLERNCFIACSSAPDTNVTATATASASTSPACLLFRMVEGQFVVYRKHVQRDLRFSRLTVAQQGRLLIGARSNGEVLVFNSPRLDCYNGFVVRGDVQPSGLLSHRNAQNESYLLLAYRRSSSDLVRMVQLGGEPQQQEQQDSSNRVGAEDLSVVQLHRHEFEDTLSSLRGLLLRRKASMEELSRWQKLLQHHSSIQLQKPFHLAAKGRIQRLQLQGSHLLSPTQLKQRLEQLRERFAPIRRSRSRSRVPRSFGTGNTSDVIELLKVKRLHVKNLIYQGQLLPGHILDASLLTLREPLRTKALHTEQLLTPQDYQNDLKTVAPSSGDPKADLWVRHLHVDRINGVSWFEFYDSLFLRSRDEQLEGRLIFQSRSRVVNLQATLLNGLVVAKLFNLRRDQVISSNLFMSAFYVSRLEAGRVNGLDFARDIVFRGGNSTWIKTPVRIYQLSVSGDILVGNQTASTEPWMQPRQTQMEKENHRLQQYYTGRVTIKGSLTLNNVKRDAQRTRLLLATGQSLAEKDLHSNYLLAHAAQNLTQLMFGNAKVTTPSLTTSHIQGHPVAEHLLTRGSQAGQAKAVGNRTLHIIFMNVTIEGDIICRDYTSRLALISREAVRHGQLANITGHKLFGAPVTVQTLLSQQLNGVPVDELVLKSQTVRNFTGAKGFQRLVVGKDMDIGKNLNASRLNGLALSQLLGHALSLQRLELADHSAGPVQLQSLHFRRLNGLPFDELLGKLSAGSEDGNAPQLLLRKQLLIEGHVRFERGLHLQAVNGIQWEDYLARLVRPDANAVLEGRKTFLAPVQLSDALQSPHVNGLDLSSLLDNTLLRTTPQAITGAYSCQRMSASNVDVPRLNGVAAQLFVDTRREQLLLQGDLTVDQLSVNGSLGCPRDLGLEDLDTRLAALWKQPWRRLVVTGDALWQEEEEQEGHGSHLNYLREHAVRREGNQTIAGHVLLRQPRLERLHTRQQQPLQADLNFTHLAADALLRWTASNESQLVEAPQQLLGPVWAKGLDLAGDGHFGRLNDIDLERLNASLYRLSHGGAIRAELRFATPPRLGRLTLGQRGLVNGARIEEIFVQGGGRPWPRASFRQLRVEQDLRLGSVNEMILDYFFEHRVPLRGPTMEVFGGLSFERLILEGRPLLRSINGIGLEDVVYRHSPRLQSFGGSKTFAGGVEFAGPGHVMHLNGKDLSERYRQSIFKDRDYNIDSLWLDEARFPAGLLYVDERPPPPADYLLREAASEREPEALQALEDLLQKAKGEKASKRRLLYLDYDQQPLKALWFKAAAATATNESFDLQGRLSLGQQSSDICQGRQLRAQLQWQPARVHLVNVSLSSELLRVDSGDIRIKVQNHCQRPVKRLRSTIRIECRNESFTLGMRQPVEHLEMLDEALILLGSGVEVRILRLSTSNCSLTDWQSLDSVDGRLMKIIRTGKPQKQQLLLASGVHSHRPALAIHLRDASSERFLLAQLIDGDYDQAEFHEDQLMLSCRGCRHIAIFMLSPNDNHTQADGPRFVPLQQLRLQESIQQILPLSVGGERYLLVLTQPEAKPFYLFSYGQVGGWQQHSYGHKGDGQQWALPLVQSGEQLQQKEAPLMLLCGGVEGAGEGAAEGECTLVRALLD